MEHGAQPLLDTVNGNVLTVNGEIYNHKELRARAQAKPHEFQTASDCEVILYLYDERDPREWLNRMNGIFAFVIYDPRRRRLHHRPRPHGRQPALRGAGTAKRTSTPPPR